MQLQTLFLSFFLSSVATAMPDMAMKDMTMTKAMTDECMCRDMRILMEEVSLASNATKIAMEAGTNATKIAEIKAKGIKASAELATMPANATLTAICKVVEGCDKMTDMTALMALVANPTALNAKTKGDAAMMAMLKSEAVTGMTEYNALMANATLMALCVKYPARKQAATTSMTMPMATGMSMSGAASLTGAKFSVLVAGLLAVVGSVTL